MLYIPEALRHTEMTGLQPGSTQAYRDDRTSTWMNQKRYTTLPRFSCLTKHHVSFPNNFQGTSNLTIPWLIQIQRRSSVNSFFDWFL